MRDLGRGSLATDKPVIAVGYLSTDIPRFRQPLHLCFEMKSAYTLCLQVFVSHLYLRVSLACENGVWKSEGENHEETTACLPCVGTGDVFCLNRLGTSNGQLLGNSDR